MSDDDQVETSSARRRPLKHTVFDFSNFSLKYADSTSTCLDLHNGIFHRLRSSYTAERKIVHDCILVVVVLDYAPHWCVEHLRALQFGGG